MKLDATNILVPFDFSERSVNAVRRVTSSVDPDAEVHVAHIIDDYYAEYAAIRFSETMVSKQRILHRRKMAERLASAGIEASTLLLHCEMGSPGPELVRLARTLKADLVIIPSLGRSGISRLLLGSVAERVAHLAPCHVLILKDELTNVETETMEAISS